MTKDEIKAITTVPEVLQRFGVEVKRGRCKAICHDGSNLTAKVSDDLYFCFKCNKQMDIFDITMHLNHCDFRTAFELLGGTDKPSFTATIKANRAKIEREQRIARKLEIETNLRQIQMNITAYRNLIELEQPYSELWGYYYNKLQYQLYLLEYYAEKR